MFQKRVMVYPNGESLERAVYVWGNTVEEILDNATMKLGMWQRARLLFSMEGKLVCFCLFSSKGFLQSKPKSFSRHSNILWVFCNPFANISP